jgi:hypothetical protein
MLVLLLVNIIYIPLRLTFSLQEQQPIVVYNRYEPHLAFEIIFLQLAACLFVVDLLISFNTAYY